MRSISIIEPIYDSLIAKYGMIYGGSIKKSSIEGQILEEILAFSKKLTTREALLFSNLMSLFNQDLASKEQKLWREFVFCHMVFLFGKKMFSFDVWLLRLVCDAINRNNIFYEDVRYLKLLGDERWMMSVFEHAIFVDFSSSLANQYKVDNDRVQRVFLFLCKRIQHDLAMIPIETEMSIVKKEMFKKVKSYQSSMIFKRSVTI